MRDYRGKRTDTGAWVHGSLVIWQHGTVSVDDGRYDSPQMAVDPATAGQCTGVLGLFHFGDKVKDGAVLQSFIYEGDIVEPVLNEGTYSGFSWGRQVVIFDRGAFCLRSHRGEITPLRSYAANVKFKVWGNVHDNPELLEVET